MAGSRNRGGGAERGVWVVASFWVERRVHDRWQADGLPMLMLMRCHLACFALCSLREHPRFEQVKEERGAGGGRGAAEQADFLSAMSLGRQR